MFSTKGVNQRLGLHFLMNSSQHCSLRSTPLPSLTSPNDDLLTQQPQASFCPDRVKRQGQRQGEQSAAHLLSLLLPLYLNRITETVELQCFGSRYSQWDMMQERKLVGSSQTWRLNFAGWGGGTLGEELLVHLCVQVCRGTFAIAAMEGTDGRGKWTPVPEEYCGAEDQSAAYVPPWAPVTHYSTWSPSSTSPSWTSPPRHLSPRTDNPPPPPPPSQRCVLANPAPLPRHPHPEKPRKQAQQLHGRYVLLFGALGRQKEFGEMTQGGDRERA
ncbi:hypothetical protein INR49_025949, partial [Caranx melampygus]